MKCLIVNNNPSELSQITNNIARIPLFELVKSCQNVSEATELLACEEIDVIIIDISVYEKFERIFKESATNEPLIIFIAEDSTKAIDGFRFNAIDYLVKPITYKALLNSALKASKQHRYLFMTSQIRTNANPVSSDDRAFFVKDNESYIRIDTDDIKYIEHIDNKHIAIWMDSCEEPIIVPGDLAKIENKFVSPEFMRIHNSYIVNFKKIKKISRLRLFFDDRFCIQVADSYKDMFISYINNKSNVSFLNNQKE